MSLVLVVDKKDTHTHGRQIERKLKKDSSLNGLAYSQRKKKGKTKSKAHTHAEEKQQENHTFCGSFFKGFFHIKIFVFKDSFMNIFESTFSNFSNFLH